MNPSFGSGTNLLGANAGQLLGMPSALQQQSPASAGFQPGTLPSMQQPEGNAPQAQTMAPIPGATPPANQLPSGVPQAPQPQQGTVGMPPGPSETQMILKSLISRLAMHNDHEKAVRNAMFPQQNET